jgi:hypothetical protein
MHPRVRRNPLEGGVYSRAGRNPLEGAFEWAALVGRGDPRGVGRAPCVYLSGMRLFWFFAGFKQGSPGCFRGPSGLSPTLAVEVHGGRGVLKRLVMAQDQKLTVEAAMAMAAEHREEVEVRARAWDQPATFIRVRGLEAIAVTQRREGEGTRPTSGRGLPSAQSACSLDMCNLGRCGSAGGADVETTASARGGAVGHARARGCAVRRDIVVFQFHLLMFDVVFLQKLELKCTKV